MGVLVCISDRFYIEWSCVCRVLVTTLMLLPVASFAAQWTISPSLQVKETYTDNVTFTEPAEEDYITEINPGVALRADGRRLTANLGYTLQNLFYAKDSSRNTRFHSLGAGATAELIKDFGFLNVRASDSQRVISPSLGLPVDNLSIVNRTDIQSLAINPYVKHRFGGVAEASASYSYETVRYAQGVSDAEIEAMNVGLNSGPSFQRLSWSLNYSQRNTNRKDASDYSREFSILQTDYRINRKWGVLFRAGTERNDLATPQNRGFRNGSYFAAGVRLTPHSTLRIDLLAGTRLDSASLFWEPSPRSVVDISWRDQKVGLNPGKVWKGSIRLGSRRATWGASYLEDTTSVQGLQSLGASFLQTRSLSKSRGSTPRAVSPQSGDLSTTAFPLSNELFLRKRAQLIFGYKTAKSDINIIGFAERRELLTINDGEKIRGGNVSWRWRFATRTDMLLRYRSLNSDYRASAGGGSGKFRSADVSFSRQLGRGVDGRVMARSTSQDGLVGGRSYDEKRLSVSVNWLF